MRVSLVRRRPLSRLRTLSRQNCKRRRRCAARDSEERIISGKIAAFEDWAAQVGIEWSRDALSIVGEVGNRRVLAKRALHQGEIIIRVPPASCISVDSSAAGRTLSADSSFQKFLREHDDPDDEMTHPLPLTVCLMYEIARGHQSTFFPYVDLLPDCEPGVPFTWPEKAMRLLQGTEMVGLRHTKLEELRDDWRNVVKELISSYPDEFPPAHFTFQKYVSAASLVISRSFPITAAKGGTITAMVPFLDLLNHRHEHSANWQDYKGKGKELQQNQDREVKKRNKLEDEEEAEEGNELDKREGHELPVAEMQEDEQTGDALMIMRCPCQVGGEVCHNYGLSSASEHLFRYGFLPSSESSSSSQTLLAAPCLDDFVTISTALIANAASICSQSKTSTASTIASIRTADGLRERLEFVSPILAEASIVDDTGCLEVYCCRAGQGEEGRKVPVGLLLLIAILALPSSDFAALVEGMRYVEQIEERDKRRGTIGICRISHGGNPGAPDKKRRYEPASLFRLVAIVRRLCEVLRGRARSEREVMSRAQALQVVEEAFMKQEQQDDEEGDEEEVQSEEEEEEEGEEDSEEEAGNEREEDGQASDDDGKEAITAGRSDGARVKSKRRARPVWLTVEDLLSDGAEECLFIPAVKEMMLAVFDCREGQYPAGTTLAGDRRLLDSGYLDRSAKEMAPSFNYERAALHLRLIERGILASAREWVCEKSTATGGTAQAR
eukprot:TRINITY_DN12961_c0_g1_i1.p1 TRINITY_DN12961_c0_g1~~TRINITY_DN12961_c0_g1_i1.p1  ORF type:complete len:725 (-),score=122.20 TRINITY_DN12961_c0_g1_i1:37-2211(-)